MWKMNVSVVAASLFAVMGIIGVASRTRMAATSIGTAAGWPNQPNHLL